MTPETKAQWKSVGKTGGVIGAAAAVVVGITLVVLPPAPQKKVLLRWDHPNPEQVIFEIVSRTNLQGSWRFKTNVVGTNAVTFQAAEAQEFFTISKVMDRQYTNVAIRQKGF